jgi:uncharacterized protein (TIGR02246 family)
VTAEVEELERRGWDALSGADGAAFYRDVMAEDGLMLFPGAVLDKAESVRAIEGATPWSRYELTDVRVIEATPDSAIVAYRAEAQRPGRPPYEAVMTTVYARRDGRWQMILHQQSPTPKA